MCRGSSASAFPTKSWKCERTPPCPSSPGISQKDAVRVLQKIGYVILRQGKHITMSNVAVMVQIPRHDPINAYTMGYIAACAGLNPDQFRNLL